MNTPLNIYVGIWILTAVAGIIFLVLYKKKNPGSSRKLILLGLVFALILISRITVNLFGIWEEKEALEPLNGAERFLSAFIDSLQSGRYRKLESVVGLITVLNLIVCGILFVTGRVPLKDSFNSSAICALLAIVAKFVSMILDIRRHKGNTGTDNGTAPTPVVPAQEVG